ncbi:MarR family transcriptional regulator [Streptomyces flavofungini]|uniref:MarR family transcriptional regulator n=1 Tax=Streptomyces flavofungini TaxID=68200 RepID=A0ABS0XAN0_9ACTN|nr:MarR family transcriptional regulator [Streptomyces flavofungini]
MTTSRTGARATTGTRGGAADGTGPRAEAAAAPGETAPRAKGPGSPARSELQAAADRRVCGLVGTLARRIDAHVRDRATTLGLTAPQAVALRELTGPLTLRELAERMCCEPSNATFVSDRLEEQGLVERRPHPSDRRAKQLVLTPDGSALRERLMALLSAESPLAPLTQQEQDTLQDLLQRAVDR